MGNLDLAHAINFNPAYPSTDYNDEFGHGTHAAGVAGSLTNNALGVAGINWQVLCARGTGGWETDGWVWEAQ